MVCHAVSCCVQDADWEYNEDAADDDLDQGASDEEGLADDPGYRKQLGECVCVHKGLGLGVRSGFRVLPRQCTRLGSAWL